MKTVHFPSIKCGLLVVLLAASCLVVRCPGVEAQTPVAPGAADSTGWLWEIGRDDGQDSEFALAPADSGQYQDDAFFVIGQSDPKKDWPYVQPGPRDAWAGSRPHTFSIGFGLTSNVPSQGEYTLAFALVDTHYAAPPHLRIEVNGQLFEQSLPAGAGDASIQGHPESGLHHRFEIKVPASLMHAGTNVISITIDQGSWMIYDWVGMRAPASVELAPIMSMATLSATAVRALVEKDGKLWQPLQVKLRYAGPAAEAAILSADGIEVGRHELRRDEPSFEVLVPPADAPRSMRLVARLGTQSLEQTVKLLPVRRMTVYIVPHSHNDIGFTEIQTEVEKRQMENLRLGMELARKTADYPPGARFVWNMEVLWAANLYEHRMSEADRAQFDESVKRGQVVLTGQYLNELTGLCRPEELLQLFRYGTQLAERTGTRINTAMTSDVPGTTWGTVSAMAQAGLRYFSTAPNFFDRIGTIMVQWQDKPFWWISPSGKQRVLVWVPRMGYALSTTDASFLQMNLPLAALHIGDYQTWLDLRRYPYDLSYVRSQGGGDNSAPDAELPDFVRGWNARYTWPKLAISSVDEPFALLEKRYGDKLPEYKGDLTPYWEDGAGSAAFETALSRNASERLTQAQTLYAMRAGRAGYPVAAFTEAWNRVLLFSEHTWGAFCSVSDAENPLALAQWKIKRGYALDADQQSRELLSQGAETGPPNGPSDNHGIDIFNTASWSRTEIVWVPGELSHAGDRVMDPQGQPVPSQRLAGGELAFLVRDLPAFAGRRYSISTGAPFDQGIFPARVGNFTLENDILHVRVDKECGGVAELTRQGFDGNLIDTSHGGTLNEYLYLDTNQLKDVRSNGPVTLSVVDHGPLVASVRVASAAPGCNSLMRELRLAAGSDHLDIINTLDKQRVPPNPHPGSSSDFAQRGSKESVNFAFPFKVDGGQVRVDVPFSVVRSEIDQLPGACKEWLPVGRWVDTSNERQGITLATVDTPLIELGRMTTVFGTYTALEPWRQHAEASQTIYSWVMNNYWSTNYRAYQEGMGTFRYSVRPHGVYDPTAAARFGTGQSQPLVVRAAAGIAPDGRSLLEIEPAGVVVTALKPSDDGKGWIVRLFGASGQAERATLKWSKEAAVTKTWVSNLAEQKLAPADGSGVEIAGWDLVILRAE